MISELLILGGYGQFVWPAFIFTFVSCFSVYQVTKNKLAKQEKLFLSEYNQLEFKKVDTFKEKKIAREVLSISSV